MVEYFAILYYLVLIIVQSFLLVISTKICKIEGKNYKNSIIISILLVSAWFAFNRLILANLLNSRLVILLGYFYLLWVPILLAFMLIKYIYKLPWGKAFVIWLIWFGLSKIISYLSRFMGVYPYYFLHNL